MTTLRYIIMRKLYTNKIIVIWSIVDRFLTDNRKDFHMFTLIGLDIIILGNSMLSRISYMKGH